VETTRRHPTKGEQGLPEWGKNEERTAQSGYFSRKKRREGPPRRWGSLRFLEKKKKLNHRQGGEILRHSAKAHQENPSGKKKNVATSAT